MALVSCCCQLQWAVLNAPVVLGAEVALSEARDIVALLLPVLSARKPSLSLLILVTRILTGLMRQPEVAVCVAEAPELVMLLLTATEAAWTEELNTAMSLLLARGAEVCVVQEQWRCVLLACVPKLTEISCQRKHYEDPRLIRGSCAAVSALAAFPECVPALLALDAVAPMLDRGTRAWGMSYKATRAYAKKAVTLLGIKLPREVGLCWVCELGHSVFGLLFYCVNGSPQPWESYLDSDV